MTAEHSPRPSLSLGTWLMAAVLLAASAAVLGCALLIENFARTQAERAAHASLAQLAGDFRAALDRGMARQFQQVRVFAQLEPLQRFDDPAAVRRAMHQMQAGFSNLAWIGLTDEKGKVLAAAGGLLEGVDVSKRPWWQGAQSGPFVGDVHAAVLLEKLLPRQQEPWRFVDFALPVRGPGGELRGIFGAHLSWQWARQIKTELVDQAMQAHGAEALVLARDGTVLLGPPGTEGKPLAQDETGQYFVERVATRGYDAYPGLGWVVLMRKPVDVAMADYYELRRRIGLVALALLVLGVPLSWLLARRMAAPLVELAEAIAARAHLSQAQLPRVGGYREVELLSSALADLSARQAEQDAMLERRVAERTAELNQAMQELTASEQRLRAVTDNIPAMVGHFNRAQVCDFANDMGLRIHGLKPEDLPGLTLRAAVGEASYAQHEPFVKQVLAGKPGRFNGELVYEGEQKFFQSHLVPDHDAQGQVQGFYLMTFDITRLKQAELRLEQLSRVDALTGCPNRREFEERLPRAMARARRGDRGVMAVLFLDVDKFKSINDSLGHAVGDLVLKEFAQRLQGCVRETDTVARLGGDEFVLILEAAASSAETELVAQKIIDCMAPPFDLGAGLAPLQVSTSVGLACYPVTGHVNEDPAALLERADKALYAAKAAGRGTYRAAAFS